LISQRSDRGLNVAWFKGGSKAGERLITETDEDEVMQLMMARDKQVA